jgi:hypothetical protein
MPGVQWQAAGWRLMSRFGQSCQRTHSIGTSPLIMLGRHADSQLRNNPLAFQ